MNDQETNNPAKQDEPLAAVGLERNGSPLPLITTPQEHLESAKRWEAAMWTAESTPCDNERRQADAAALVEEGRMEMSPFEFDADGNVITKANNSIGLTQK